MRRPVLLLLSLLVFACSDSETLDREDRGSFRKGPVSIRGWFSEIDVGPPPPDVFSVTTPNARISPYQRQLFEKTNISLEGVPYASGGVRDDGSFIVLDAPSGAMLLNMQAPGVPLVQMRLENIPPNADVFIPGIKLYADRFEILRPDQVLIRVPTRGGERKKAERTAKVGEHAADVWEVPLREMMDRRDWPVPN